MSHAATDTRTGTGTGTMPTGSSPVTTPTDLLPYGCAVTIDWRARAADGSTLTDDERMGTITGSRNHPHSGRPIYTVSTQAGTMREVHAHHVDLDTVAAEWALEIEIDGAWKPVPAGHGHRFCGATMIDATPDALYAFVLIAAARAAVPGYPVRASIAVANGLAAWHVEQPADRPADHVIVATLAGGRELAMSFGTLRARDAAIRALRGVQNVLGVQPAGGIGDVE